MQHDFDNTFDALLRRAARSAGEVLPENAAHLDADSLAAFAENVLPDTSRVRFAAHLADCSDCRQILANFALIQEADDTEIIETKEIVAVQPSWKERFARWFALPNLGYAAAALAVLFIGVFGFIAFQSNQKPAATEVAIVDEEAAGKLAKSSPSAPVQTPQPEPTAETPENSNEALATLADNTNSSENSNQSDEQSPNRGLPPSIIATRGQTNGGEQTARKETETARDSRPQPEPSATTNNVAATTGATASKPTPMVLANPAENKTQAQAAPPAAAEVQNKNDESGKAETLLDAQRAKTGSLPAARKAADAPRVVGGKTFQNLGGVWRDSAFNGQKTENVSRGSDEYKKLDAGLRSVAESFAGATVIVIWQGKAYRIR